MRLILVEQKQLNRDGLRKMTPERFVLVGEASNAAEALDLAARRDSDLVVICLPLPDMDGPTLIQKVLELRPAARVVVIFPRMMSEIAIGAIRAGARAILSNQQPASEYIRALDLVAAGEKSFCTDTQHALAKYIRSENGTLLSPRETDVLRLIACGAASSKDIAHKLGLTLNTVRFYRKTLMKKLDASNVVELIRNAVDRGEITF